MEGRGKKGGVVGKPLVKVGQKDQWDVGVLGGYVREESVDEVPELGAATRTSRKKEAVDGEMMEGLREKFCNGGRGGGGGERDDGRRVVVVGWDELS